MHAALAFHLDLPIDDVELREFHEYPVRAGDSSAPDVWVRSSAAVSDNDALRRRATREAIEHYLHDRPAITFDNGTATTGDVIAYAALPDDLFASVLEQVGNCKRLYVAMGEDANRAIYWQCPITPDADDFDPRRRSRSTSSDLETAPPSSSLCSSRAPAPRMRLTTS